jgi:hypothetical protein
MILCAELGGRSRAKTEVDMPPISLVNVMVLLCRLALSAPLIMKGRGSEAISGETIYFMTGKTMCEGIAGEQ